ncbi:MAG: MOSC domain-containing protein [Mycobacteriales bacterium]
MKEIVFEGDKGSPAATFAACVATILELPVTEVPEVGPDQDPATSWEVSRWLGGLGLGLAAVADPASFAWAGPWLARVRPPGEREPRFVVMYGVPSGVAWDPSGVSEAEGWTITDGYLLAPGDVALARPARPALPTTVGTVEAIWVASAAGQPARSVASVAALAGRGLEGDRHVAGTGTFPSGLPGSALTLIESEVCDSFSPPLAADEHRRNVVTRGIQLNALVGREFMIGPVRCRGARLCEPCRVIVSYAGRSILRPLVHRGGLRADILDDGRISVGDRVMPVT